MQKREGEERVEKKFTFRRVAYSYDFIGNCHVELNESNEPFKQLN